mmetsp:Transcript_16274/g.46309  ORF Transcript_16274/g.46309 Transcript_16274/m.46309 type:complete len:462 (+) Transcript_16274:1252-2637(+)
MEKRMAELEVQQRAAAAPAAGGDTTEWRELMEKRVLELAEVQQQAASAAAASADVFEWRQLVEKRLCQLEEGALAAEERSNDLAGALLDLVPEGGAPRTAAAWRDPLRRAVENLQADVSALRADAKSAPPTATADFGAAAGKLDELRSRMAALEGALRDAGVVSPAAMESRLHRQRFEEACRTSAWRPTVTLRDVCFEHKVASNIMKFAGNFAGLTGFFTVLDRVGEKRIVKRLRAEARLAALTEEVQAHPTATNVAALAHELATAMNAHASANAVCAADIAVQRGRAIVSIGACASRQDLDRVVRLVQDEGALTDHELRRLVADAMDRFEEEQRIGDLRRRLRWANEIMSIDQLQNLIASAQQKNLEAWEMAAAERRIGELQAARLGEEMKRALRAAKPNWTDHNITAARAKLAKVGILSLGELQKEILPETGTVNELLRAQGEKAFSEETLQALRTALL